jgi:DNA polymerase-3 subunit delta
MRLEPVFLLAGPEAGRRAAFMAELRAEIRKQDGADAEEHRLYAPETGVGPLLSLVRNGSLFSSRRLVEYRNAELVKGKEDTGALASYIASASTDVILLLVTDSFGVEKALEEAVGKDRKRMFYELFDNEKPRWLRGKLREYGLGAEDEAIEAILELVENDTAALESACARLAVVFPEGRTLDEADIEAAVSRNRQEDAFSLFDRMARDEPDRALEVLEAVLQDRQGGAVQILAAMVWSFRRLMRVGDLLGGGDSLETACLKSGIRAKSLQALHREALSRYSREDCERILRLAADTDARVRGGGSVLERPLLQLFVYGAMVKKGHLALTAAG